MSRTIDLDNLSEDDILYLAERERLPEGVEDPREIVEMSEVELDTEYTGDVGTSAANVVVDEEIFSEYEDMTANELKDELKSRDLPTSGTKAEMIARLEEDDQPAEEELVEE